MAEPELIYKPLPDGSWGSWPIGTPDEKIQADIQQAYPNQKSVAQAGQESAIQESQSSLTGPATELAKRSAIPVAAGLATLGTANPFVGATIMAGGTAWNQLLGLEQSDPKEVVKSFLMPMALSGALPALQAGSKAISNKLFGASINPVKTTLKGVAEIINPAAVREAGVESVARGVGQPGSTLEFLATTPASKAAYQAVQQEGKLTTDGINGAIQGALSDILDLSNPPQRAVKYLQNMNRKFPATGPSGNIQRLTTNVDYGQVAKELQAMKREADSLINGSLPSGKVSGIALYDAREKILEELDKISPRLRNANAIYRKEEMTNSLREAMRKGTPSNSVRQFLENNRSMAAKTYTSEEQADIIRKADLIDTVASSTPTGPVRQFISAAGESIAQGLSSEQGRKMIGLLFEAPQTPAYSFPAKLATLAQFMRAYQAQSPQP